MIQHDDFFGFCQGSVNLRSRQAAVKVIFNNDYRVIILREGLLQALSAEDRQTH